MNEFSNYLNEFNTYVRSFDSSNDEIKLKYDHSIRVMELSNKYAKLLGFNEEDVELATLIGLLHDIGRFEQQKKYHTFIDKDSVDHADYSVELLFDKKIIRNFTTKEEWYPIIEFAVKNHNKLDIPETKDERILKHTRLIRDTDTPDILVATSGTTVGDGSEVSVEIMDFLKRHFLADKRYMKTKSDFIVVQYIYAFGRYYDVILEEYKNNLIKFHESIKGNENLKEAYEEVIKYLDERIDKYDGNRNEIQS